MEAVSTKKRPTGSKKKKESRFSHLCHENRYVLLAFFMSMLVSALFAICYSVFPFGDISVLRMDLYHQYGPLFGELYDRLTGSGSLTYSWSSGGGGSFVGNFFNYLSSPLSLLVLLFGHRHVPEAIGFLMAVKAALAAAFFAYYLKKSSQFKSHSAVTAGFGLLYSFSAWFVAYYWNVMWIDGMMLLPLIVLGLEKLVDDRKPWLYTISLTVLMVSSYYMSYMVAMFLVLYFLTYHIAKYPMSSTLYQPKENNKLSAIAANRFLRSLLRCIVYAAIAGALSAFALLPTYFALKSCSATSGNFPSKVRVYFNFFDFLAQHFASLEPTIRSSGDPVLPNVYCGVGTILLAVLFYFVKSISTREKVAYTVLLGVLIASFDINYLDYIWHGFHFPNDLPYRQSFVYIFVLLVLAFKTVKHIKEIKGRDLLTVGIIFALFVVIVEKIGSEHVQTSTVITTLVLIIVYTAAYSLLNNRKVRTEAAAAVLFCCMFAEVAIADVNHFEIDQPISTYAGDYDSVQRMKALIAENENDDNSFYRTERTGPLRLMDPSWYDYNGIDEFSSMAYEKTANLQYNLGLSSNYINSYTYALNTPVYNAMFAMKYIINNDSTVPMDSDIYSKIGTVDSVPVYKDNYSLPLAYAVNNSVQQWNYYASSPFKIQSDFFERASGVADVFDSIPIDNIDYSNIQEFPEDIQSGSYTFQKMLNDEDGSFTVTFTVPKTQEVYVYLRSPGVDKITYRSADGTVDRSQSTIDNTEYVFNLGKLNAGTVVSLTAECGDNSGNVEFYAAGLNLENFQQGYKILNDSGAMKITKLTDTNIEGTVTLEEDQMLYTSINYDDGWTVSVDGKEVPSSDIVKVGSALIGVKMSAGTHNVSFKFHTKGAKEGFLLSAGTLLIILLICFIRKKKKGSSSPKKQQPKVHNKPKAQEQPKANMQQEKSDQSKLPEQPKPAELTEETAEKEPSSSADVDKALDAFDAYVEEE